jgi:OFA family oxalate/formate antiporter-like MFS transporter
MKTQHRALKAFIGQLAMLFAGMIYAWSVLSSPIAAEFSNWNKVQLSFTFTLVMIMFCIGSLVGGLLSGKIKVRYYLWVSAALFIAGFLISSRSQSLLSMYIGFGVLCGLASGITYNGVMSTVCAWYPEKLGFISGWLLMAFGIGSFVIGKVFQHFTPGVVGAWRTSFLYLGIIIFAVFMLCSLFLSAPGKDFVAPPSKKIKKIFSNPVSLDVSAKEMMTKTTFWFYYLWAIVISIAGLSLISQASFVVKEVNASITPGTIATVVGLISVFNGLGRILAGFSFDKFGRRLTMRTINAGFLVTAAVLGTSIMTDNFILLIVGFILGGLSYGGVTPTNSAFTNSYFGNTNYPINFSITNSNMIIASFGSTVAGALFDMTRSYLSICILMAVMAGLGMLFSVLISFSFNKIILEKRRNVEAFEMH